MILLNKTELDLQRFVEQHRNKSVWQIEDEIKKFLKISIRDELNVRISKISSAVDSFREK